MLLMIYNRETILHDLLVVTRQKVAHALHLPVNYVFVELKVDGEKLYPKLGLRFPQDATFEDLSPLGMEEKLRATWLTLKAEFVETLERKLKALKR